MTSREQFEAWHKRNMQALVASGQTGAARSLEDLKDAMWACWSSSRLAVVVELPAGGYFAGYDNEHMMESRDVRDALEAQGLRVRVRT